MIFISHNGTGVVDIEGISSEESHSYVGKPVVPALLELAECNPSSFICWYHADLKGSINRENWERIFHHPRIMASYSSNRSQYMGPEIGYVEDTLFIKVNYEVPYPTWQMSSDVGGVHAFVVNAYIKNGKKDSNFDYFLNSLAKTVMPEGLFCYSHPHLLKKNFSPVRQKIKTSGFKLFRFVREHYKTSWVLILFFNLLVYQKRIALTPLLYSLFFRSKKRSFQLEEIEINKNKQLTASIDVVIPTIGRKEYLLDVLTDLADQSLKPKRLIIVEQNPDVSAESALEYLYDREWPFEIKHHFIHQTGACNARNIALKELENEWVFLADDDIRFPSDFFHKAFENIYGLKAEAVTISCLRKGQSETAKTARQWISFGSGCSILKTEIAKNTFFSMAFEHGFGEDTDYGMQLRNSGCDVLYLPSPSMLHLKAPIGGFRSEHEFLWDTDKISPKPSPTIMLYKMKYASPQQLRGYKTVLFFKYYFRQSIKNPFKYIAVMNKKWKHSKHWASKLMETE